MNGATSFVHFIRDQGKLYNPPDLKIAKVLSLEPLKIKIDGIEKTKNLFINPCLRIRKKDEFEDIFDGEDTKLSEIKEPYVWRVVEHNGETKDEMECTVKESKAYDFLQEFFEVFVIDVDDLVAVQQAEENFIILNKIERVGN